MPTLSTSAAHSWSSRLVSIRFAVTTLIRLGAGTFLVPAPVAATKTYPYPASSTRAPADRGKHHYDLGIVRTVLALGVFFYPMVWCVTDPRRCPPTPDARVHPCIRCRMPRTQLQSSQLSAFRLPQLHSPEILRASSVSGPITGPCLLDRLSKIGAQRLSRLPPRRIATSASVKPRPHGSSASPSLTSRMRMRSSSGSLQARTNLPTRADPVVGRSW
jgi:hypothetical protein